MIYTVTFQNIAQERGDYAIFSNLDDAQAFIATRHEGYGESYVITESSEDGERSKQIPIAKSKK